MDFQKFTNPSSLDLTSPVTYLTKTYLQSQQHPNLHIFKNDHFLVPFSIKDAVARSIEKSPFGSFLKLSELRTNLLSAFEKEVTNALQKQKVDQLYIKHPPSIYSDFVDSTELTKVGYHLQYNDINQHIVLSDNWEDQIHDTQKRKIKSLERDGFEFHKIPISDLELAHQFLTICRQVQGLEINVSFEKLQQLTSQLPGSYEIFSVQRAGKLSAVCITMNVTGSIAYYYLAGTSPLFRSHSPMVLLIAGMVNHYRHQGYKFFDLGVSSFEGHPQETLRLFKGRMGAQETHKPTFYKSLRQ